MRDVSSSIVRVRDQVWSRVWNGVRIQVRNRVNDQVWNGVRGQVGHQTMAQVRSQWVR